jgi:hypothetical protein
MTIWGLPQSVEDLAIEQLIAKAGGEALDVAVLPGAAPLDVGGLGPTTAIHCCTIVIGSPPETRRKIWTDGQPNQTL